MSKYVIDIKNSARPEQLKELLEGKWKVKQLSERTFEAEGDPCGRPDLRDMWAKLGNDGHVYVYDTETGSEAFHQRKPKGRKREVARDEDLDPKTVEVVGDYNMELGGDF